MRIMSLKHEYELQARRFEREKDWARAAIYWRRAGRITNAESCERMIVDTGLMDRMSAKVAEIDKQYHDRQLITEREYYLALAGLFKTYKI